MKILNNFRNDLLKRKEVELVVTSGTNPGLDKVLKDVAEHLKVSPEVVCVKSLKGRFGRDEFTADVLVYDSVKDKERIEPKIRVKKADAAASAAGGAK